jgi:hypothetical protein
MPLNEVLTNRQIDPQNGKLQPMKRPEVFALKNIGVNKKLLRTALLLPQTFDINKKGKQMTKKAYQRGKKVKSFAALMDILNNGGMVYIYGRVYHLGWVENLKLSYLNNAINVGHVYHAKGID